MISLCESHKPLVSVTVIFTSLVNYHGNPGHCYSECWYTAKRESRLKQMCRNVKWMSWDSVDSNKNYESSDTQYLIIYSFDVTLGLVLTATFSEFPLTAPTENTWNCCIQYVQVERPTLSFPSLKKSGYFRAVFHFCLFRVLLGGKLVTLPPLYWDFSQ